MPTILRTGPYRFYFYSHEPNEPAHVHVDRDNCSAKIWLGEVRLAGNHGFSSRELNRIVELAKVHRAELMSAWNGYFGVGSR